MQFDSPRKLIGEYERPFLDDFLIISFTHASNSHSDKAPLAPTIIDSYPPDISKAKLPSISNIASVEM